MAAKNNQSGFKFWIVVLLVVIVSTVMGYYLAGAGRQPGTPAPTRIAQTTTDTGLGGAQKPADPNAIIAQGGDYTAPGAPKIEIHEVKPPRLTDTSHVAKPTPKPADSEASQEGSPDANADTPPAPDNADLTSPVTGDTTANSSAGADPDYESVGSDAASPDQDNTQSGSGGPYHVQVGSFGYSRNAKVLADALRSRGYTTTTIEEKTGDKTVYHVETGAFRSQKAADKSSQDLKNAGFPAFTKQGQ